MEGLVYEEGAGEAEAGGEKGGAEVEEGRVEETEGHCSRCWSCDCLVWWWRWEADVWYATSTAWRGSQHLL